jgi:hypothetical protein
MQPTANAIVVVRSVADHVRWVGSEAVPIISGSWVDVAEIVTVTVARLAESQVDMVNTPMLSLLEPVKQAVVLWRKWPTLITPLVVHETSSWITLQQLVARLARAHSKKFEIEKSCRDTCRTFVV